MTHTVRHQLLRIENIWRKYMTVRRWLGRIESTDKEIFTFPQGRASPVSVIFQAKPGRRTETNKIVLESRSPVKSTANEVRTRLSIRACKGREYTIIEINQSVQRFIEFPCPFAFSWSVVAAFLVPSRGSFYTVRGYGYSFVDSCLTSETG